MAAVAATGNSIEANGQAMPKEPKKKASVSTGRAARHAPLGQVIQEDAARGQYAARKRVVLGGGGGAADDDGGEATALLDERTSRRILEMSREQRREVEDEEARRLRRGEPPRRATPDPPRGRRSRTAEESSDDDDDASAASAAAAEEEEETAAHDAGYVRVADRVGLTPAEEALLADMMGDGGEDDGDGEMPARRNLADIILAKIEEKEARAHAGAEGGGAEEEAGMELPPKVVQVSGARVAAESVGATHTT